MHIPFCIKKCGYCDFVSCAGKENLAGAYIDALIKEAGSLKEQFSSHIADTVFVGGGTPSILEEGLMSKLFKDISEIFNIEKYAEITIEANPGTLSKNKLEEYKKCGITRISLGLQSHDDNILKNLGRLHDFGDFAHSYDMVKEAGFGNINIDIMFGLPGQDLKIFEETLDIVTGLQPKHISAYALKIEEGTPFFEKYKGKEITSEETERDMYHSAVYKLEKAGYIHYETSNFAKKGYECAHNLKYWTQKEYLGLGVAAHSYCRENGNMVRRRNTEDAEDYMEAVKNNKTAVKETYIIDERERQKEYIMLNMRLKKGIVYKDFQRRFGMDFRDKFKGEIEKLKKAGMIRETKYAVRPLLKGFDLQNTLILEFIKKI